MSQRWTAAAALITVLALESNAEAIRTLKLPLIDGMTCNVSVYSGFQTVIYLPETANHGNAGDRLGCRVTVENRGMRYLVQPKGWPPPTNINLRTASATLSLQFSMTKSTKNAVTVIRFTYPSEWENPHDALRQLCGPQAEPNVLDFALMTARRDEIAVAPGFREVFESDAHKLALTTGPLNHSDSRLSFALHYIIRETGNIRSWDLAFATAGQTTSTCAARAHRRCIRARPS